VEALGSFTMNRKRRCPFIPMRDGDLGLGCVKFDAQRDSVFTQPRPIGDETLIARPLGLLRMVNAASPAYLARYGIPRSLEDLQRQEHRTIHFSTDAGRKTRNVGKAGFVRFD
jgi:hypothetical protein